MSNILVVEDEKHLANGLRFNLEAEGHKVTLAGDGESAIDLLSKDSFDAVVLDVMLPGIDGFEVASNLRKSGKFVPILMLTALGRPEDVLLGFDAGADDYLPKPFELKILIARVHGLLRRGDWARQNDKKTGDGSSRSRDRKGTPSCPHTAEGPPFKFAGKTLDF